MDEPLLRYLAVGYRPSDPKEIARVIRASAFLKMDENHRLWAKSKGIYDREIPPMKHRMKILSEIATALAFPNGKRLYDLVKERYYWDGMMADCLAVCASLIPR